MNLFNSLSILIPGIRALVISDGPTMIARIEKLGQSQLDASINWGFAGDRLIVEPVLFPEEILSVVISMTPIIDPTTNKPIEVWFRGRSLADLKKFFDYLASVANKFRDSLLVGLEVLRDFADQATILMGRLTIAIPFTMKERVREKPLSKNEVKAIARHERRLTKKEKQKAFAKRKEAWPPKNSTTVVHDPSYAVATGGRGVVVTSASSQQVGDMAGMGLRSHAPDSNLAQRVKKMPLALMIKANREHEELSSQRSLTVEAGHAEGRWLKYA